MAEIGELLVEAREAGTKGAVRALRRAGRVPAVVYGLDMPPRTVSIEQRSLELELHRGGFMNRLYNLKIDDKVQRVLPRDVQFHVVSDQPLHVDFLRLSEDAVIEIMVPVVFLNEEACDGIRRGGILNVVRHEIEFSCRADAIPEHIECDLTGLDIGDSIHISHIPLPPGVTPTITDRDFTVATIAAPTVVRDEAIEAAAAAQAAEATEAEGEAEAEGAAEGEAGEGSAVEKKPAEKAEK